jgi:SHS2 domain-containing protein
MHEWIDHTGELELRVTAPTAAEALDDATAAMGEVLGEPQDEPVGRPLAVDAGDPPALLAAWLEELVFLAEEDRLVPQGARRVELEPGRLRGQLVARRGRPSYLVKAVTYHRLTFEARDGQWRATVVLDV